MEDAGRCSIESCERPIAASLDRRSLCREHFISTCYEQLECYSQLQTERRLGEIAAEAVRRFIHECVRQADIIEHATRHLDNLERARLLDIVLWASELGCRLRRSPRKVMAIPLRVRFEKPGHPWEEKTMTRLVSRHGALLECQHPVEVDQTLSVERMDTGRQARARVVWSQNKGERHVEVGIEFPDCDNFWELDWSAD